jgi:EF-P beta-lysylation protein EpmB
MVKFAVMAIGTPIKNVSHTSRQTDWQSILADSIRSPAELCRRLRLDPSLAVEAEQAAGPFSLLVPQPYLARIRPGDPTDPLLLQVMPRMAETAVSDAFGPDPLGERTASCCPGLLQKYQGRLLIVTTGACAVHCRFCFRRYFPYEKMHTQADHLALAHQKIAADDSLREVILSGGDPLMLQNSQIAHFINQLAEIPALRRLRIHSRMPITVPQRVDDGLLSLLRGNRLSVSIVVHANHPAEIDDDVAAGLGRLIDAGVPVLHQAVLLRDVNDRADVLAELYERLIDLRVMPYYLHQLDRVAGAMHFEVPVEEGLALIAELRRRLPGYAVPRYVRETVGGASKEVLA